MNIKCLCIFITNKLQYCFYIIKNQRTPIYGAIFRGFTKLVSLLLKYGADPNVHDKVSVKIKSLVYKIDIKIAFNIIFLEVHIYLLSHTGW